MIADVRQLFATPTSVPIRFADRGEAGRRLAEDLRKYAGREDVIVLALPRGGVPVGYEVAKALAAPLDVFVVRKLGLPWQEELAMGAIASGGIRLINQAVVSAAGVSEEEIDQVADEELAELERRERQYRGDRPFPNLMGKTVILVDDGLATGSSMKAAIAAVRQKKPNRVVVAVPVSARETCLEVRAVADEIICAEEPEPFYAVGMWYDNFDQTTDEEVHDLLEKGSRS